jgi:hypothetical protein
MEYIESELARRQNRTQANNESSAASRLNQSDANDSFSNAFSKREPATLGKLHEIDLGQETKLQNIARTEAATRRMAGESPDAVEEVGKNGKPWGIEDGTAKISNEIGLLRKFYEKVNVSS